MTRKQALSLAIQRLSANPEDKAALEAAQVLHSLEDDLPFVRWSEDGIHDTIQQFIIDNERVPTVSDFKRKGMPPHPVFKNRYGLTLGEWLSNHYPADKTAQIEAQRVCTQDFIEDYNHIKPRSADEFDAHRRHTTRCWFTIARYNGERTWTGLLNTLNLPSYSHIPMKKEHHCFSVSVISDYSFRD